MIKFAFRGLDTPKGSIRDPTRRVWMKVLVVEDYEPLRESMRQGLLEDGYAVDATGEGEEGLWLARTGEYDVIVLDLMLPGMDGLEILTHLRSQGDSVHVLILTARDALEDRIAGLDLGADDYLVKPFDFGEFLARVRALVRRRYDSKTPVLKTGDLTVDTVGKKAFIGDRELDLTSREFALLELLAHMEGKVLSREMIRERIYDFASDPASNVIDVYIGRLRRKIEQCGGKKILHTRRGFGYVLEGPD
jgi:two-component system copper resistance phosphate regulon response regulator CusR